MATVQTHDASAVSYRSVRHTTTLRRWSLFVGIGIALYLGLYAWSEYLVYRHGEKNRFFMIRTAPQEHYSTVLLGASHAMPFGFADANGRLEEATGSSIINLSIEGGGVLPNWLLLDYFLAQHSADNVVFFLDSFGFYSSRWNEERLDAAALQRAPLDPELVAALWRHDWSRPLIPAYLSGFPKINDHNRFEADLAEAEAKFDTTYRPLAQMDRQRLRFLYPDGADPEALQRYLSRFDEFLTFIEERGMEAIVIKPPTPPRYRDNLPSEPEFDAAVGALMADHGVAFYDFSSSLTEDAYFYDTDHLNRDGVTAFVASHLAETLRRHR